VSRPAPPPPAVHAVWHHGPAPPLSTDTWALVGQDGGQSIDLGDDVLFVFADTLLATPAALRAGWPSPRWPIRRGQGRFLANCCALAGRGRLPAVLGRLRYFLGHDGWPREILEATPAERLLRMRFWPEHGVAIDGRVYLFYLGIEQATPDTTWGFRNIGTGLAVLDPVAGDARRLRWDGDWRLWPSAPGDFHGGVQALGDGDYVYVFGALGQGHASEARLARVRSEAIVEPAAYEYLVSDTPAWDRDRSRCCTLGPCGHEFSVSFNRYLGGYLMCFVDSTGCTLSVRFAEHLWGPYSDPRSLGALPIDPRNDMAALGFEHPLYATDGGRTIALSYCQPNFTPNGLVGVRFA
jgi:hypothetical protein